MKKKTALFLVIMTLILAFTNAVDAQLLKRISGDHIIGTVTKEEYKKLTDYAVQKDSQAFKSALTLGIMRGTATIFKSGEEVFVVDTAIFSGMIKVRRKGEVKEYWTKFEAVK